MFKTYLEFSPDVSQDLVPPLIVLIEGMWLGRGRGGGRRVAERDQRTAGPHVYEVHCNITDVGVKYQSKAGSCIYNF